MRAALPRGAAAARGALAICAWLAVAGSAEAASIRGSVTIIGRDGQRKNSSAGVVVFLDEMEKPFVAASPPPAQSLRQANKHFVPEVLPVLVGTTVEFLNDDSVRHNVFSLSRTKPFDLGIYAQGASRSVLFDKTGLAKVYCNIHPQMFASILVLANPYFTVTDSEGRFVLDGIPAGAATVRTWYAHTAVNPEKRIEAKKDGVYDVDLRVIEDLRLEIREETFSVDHKNKWGNDYPSKY